MLWHNMKSTWQGLKNLTSVFADPQAMHILQDIRANRAVVENHYHKLIELETRFRQLAEQVGRLEETAVPLNAVTALRQSTDHLTTTLATSQERIERATTRVREEVTRHLANLTQDNNLQFQDMAILLRRIREFATPAHLRLQTEHPVAVTSDDYRFPRGTLQDNTRHPRFVRSCEQIFRRPLRYLDLGCAGGGLVRDFLLRGHLAFGLEGSDDSLKWQRAEWRFVPEYLQTCDIAQPFQVLDDADGKPVQFDVIGCWEVLEHIPEAALPRLLDNVSRHLAPDGIFAASVATFEDFDPVTSARWHVTVHPKDWWCSLLCQRGFEIVEGLLTSMDFPRGSGNGLDDWNVTLRPELGFHLVARVRTGNSAAPDSPGAQL